MSGRRQLLFVFGCVICLLVAASALPAADPRIDPPGGDDAPMAGEWEALDASEISPDPATETDDESDSSDDDPAADDPDIEIDGALEPGNEVSILIDGGGPFDDREVEVNGDSIGMTDWGDATATVPYAEEMTVAVPEDNTSRTVDIETDATITMLDEPAPNSTATLAVDVGSTSVDNATVSVDGEPTVLTDDGGQATIRLPEAAGPAEVHVERGPVSGERTLEVPELEVGFVSPLLFPGSPAPVSVTADGTPVEDATVSLADGGTSTTGSDGRTHVWLPIDDTATITAAAGAESATVTVENLYLRLGALALLGSGFVIGLVVTYFRIIARNEGKMDGSRSNEHGGIGLEALFVGIASTFTGLSNAVGHTGTFASSAAQRLSELGARVWRLQLPSLSMFRGGRSRAGPSAGGFSFSLPSLGPALSSFGTAVGSLSSLGSLFTLSRGRGGAGQDESTLGSLFGRDTTDETDADDDAPAGSDRPTLADDPLGPQDPQREIRGAWHTFLDRVGLSNRETLTPGQAARHALSVGYPATQVSRLVAIVRDVEYGSRDPSPDRVRTVRDTTTDLLEQQPDEDDTEEDE